VKIGDRYIAAEPRDPPACLSLASRHDQEPDLVPLARQAREHRFWRGGGGRAAKLAEQTEQPRSDQPRREMLSSHGALIGRPELADAHAGGGDHVLDDFVGAGGGERAVERRGDRQGIEREGAFDDRVGAPGQAAFGVGPHRWCIDLGAAGLSE